MNINTKDFFDRLLEQEYNPTVKDMSNSQLLRECLKLLVDNESIEEAFDRFISLYKTDEKAKKQINTITGLFEMHHKFKKEKMEIQQEISEIDEEIEETRREIEEIKREIEYIHRERRRLED